MWKASGLRRVKRLSGLSAYIRSAPVRWVLTLAWTAVAGSLMVSPGNNGSTVDDISNLFGGTEITDAIGHIIITTILALLWCWTISLYTSAPRTTRLILVGGIVWSFGAELSQHFVPERGISLLDLSANLLGVLIGIAAYRLLIAVLQYRVVF
jgi:VanZ family protein